mmetsp:Transcript_51619/g.138575  ORF Transcript_51619/g.138575 Transcript_51619/m.138575 type:complete len:247 (+) Transcript_51619:721-1461(+)
MASSHTTNSDIQDIGDHLVAPEEADEKHEKHTKSVTAIFHRDHRQSPHDHPDGLQQDGAEGDQEDAARLLVGLRQAVEQRGRQRHAVPHEIRIHREDGDAQSAHHSADQVALDDAQQRHQREHTGGEHQGNADNLCRTDVQEQQPNSGPNKCEDDTPEEQRCERHRRAGGDQHRGLPAEQCNHSPRRLHHLILAGGCGVSDPDENQRNVPQKSACEDGVVVTNRSKLHCCVTRSTEAMDVGAINPA